MLLRRKTTQKVTDTTQIGLKTSGEEQDSGQESSVSGARSRLEKGISHQRMMTDTSVSNLSGDDRG